MRGAARLDAPLRGTSSSPGLPIQASAANTAGTPWLLIVVVGLAGVLLGAVLARKRRGEPAPAPVRPTSADGSDDTEALDDHELV